MFNPGIDPIDFGKLLWPNFTLYQKQRDIVYSVRDNYITVVPAANMVGKDFVSAFIVLWFFLTRQPCKIVTTSADFAQLESVLWGEIRRFIEVSRFPLEHDKGGPLIINHLHIRRATHTKDPKTGKPSKYRVDPLSYIIGRVAAKGEGMLGHHAYPQNWDGITPHTLFICDEASGIDDITMERGETWTIS